MSEMAKLAVQYKKEINELRKFIDEYCRPTIKKLRKENQDFHIDLTVYKIRIRDLEQGIKGYERNNNRYYSLRNKILNEDRQEISIQEAREMLNDL